ncbi:hypothetical protein WN48_08813 [Eufriesea mexicana]|uniref:F-box domain-containing protein n=1 Tax=Eufriesea mexicana TaxID=516756 RepID=A0A310SJR5_9HYME|nr:PREDICTED: uncharacterized protein LOC108552229 [Eufriesea mexicana]OAD53840.1 hypothetical protein WN48_08813 [Eufriesea mexicana]
MIFPPEIWECILIHVDPITLINLKIICKCWKDIIDKILKQSALWYKLCKNEIPKHFWTTLCETLNPNKLYTNFHEEQDFKFWMSMYKLWIKCKNMTKYNVQEEYIKPSLKNKFSEHITCIDSSGSLIAVGTSDGFIYFYNMCNLSTNTKYVVDHMECVQSVQFLRDETNTICISCSVNNHISFWDVSTLKLIHETSGKLICTSYSYCYIAMNNTISIEGSIPKLMYEFGSGNIIAIGADNNKVLFYTERGYYVHLTLDADKRTYSYTHAEPLNIRIHRYYIFKPNIIACITQHGYLGFLLQGRKWKIHNLFPMLHGIPTAVLVYTHVLILGLDSGNVHIYYVEDFGAINFNTINSKKLSLDSTAVISLNIMVHIEEYLIVTYSKKIYIVKFV